MNCTSEPVALRMSVTALATALAVVAIAGSARAEAPIAPFKAEYELLRNDKPVGSSHIELRQDGDGWHFQSETRGERGMASLVGLEVRQHLRFDWHDGQPRPLRSSYDQRATMSSRNVQIVYDWDRGRYRLTDRRGEHDRALPAGTVDRYGSAVAVATRLAAGETEFSFNVAYPDGPRQWRFRVTGKETVQVPAGSFRAVRVERVRDDDDDRQTVSWHAPDRDYLTVRTLQVEDRARIESRLR